MKRPKIEIVESFRWGVDLDTQSVERIPTWFWRLKGANSEKVCLSETFTRKADAKRAARRAKVLFSLVDIEADLQEMKRSKDR